MERAAALSVDSRAGVAAVLRSWLLAARRPHTVEAIAAAEALRLPELEALLEPRMVDGGDAARDHARRRLDAAGGGWHVHVPFTGEDRARIWLPSALDPRFLTGLDEPLPWSPARCRGPLLRLVATYLRGRPGRRALAVVRGSARELDSGGLEAWALSAPPRLLVLCGSDAGAAADHVVVDALGGAGAVVWSARPPVTPPRPASPPSAARGSG